MVDDNSLHDDPGELPLVEPAWVTTTLRLTPTPAMATVAIAVAMFASLMCFFLIASAEQSLVGWALCGLFAAPAVLIGIASVSRYFYRQRLKATDSQRPADCERLPTTAIIVMFISTYSWFLLFGLHKFGNVLFPANAAGGLKYNVTLGIALASSIYMIIHGRSVYHKHFIARHGKHMNVTAGQALVVILMAGAFGAYFAWIMAG